MLKIRIENYTLWSHLKGSNSMIFSKAVGLLTHCNICHVETIHTSSMDWMVSRKSSNPSLWWGVVNLKKKRFLLILFF